MTLLRRFPALAFALSLIAIAGFCVATESFGWLVVAGTMAALSWYYTEGPRGRTLPRWVANLLLVAAILYAIADWTQRSSVNEVMDVVGRFTLILTVIKLYESKSVRDYGQLLALGAVLMMAGALQSVDLSFAILLMAYVVLGLYVLILFQLHASFERARRSRRVLAPEGAAFVPAVQPVLGRRVRTGFGMIGAVMGATTLALSAAVFMVFPRGIIGAESPFGAAGGAGSGFTGEVLLRDNQRISSSRREVFTVALLDPRGEAIEWTGPLRLRGAVLDQYFPTEARWATSKTARESSRTMLGRGLEHFVPLGTRPIDTRVQTYTSVISMRSMASDVLFACYAPVEVALETDRSFSFESSTLLLREKRGARLGASTEYRVRFQPFPSPQTMADLTGEAGLIGTPAAYPNPKVYQFAKELLTRRGVAVQVPPGAGVEERLRWRVEVAEAIEDELQEGGFTYTADLSDFVIERGEDPTWAFLSRHRFGHCEHFAAAMVALCRSVGVEARLVTGFIAMEFDESARHYVVRETNAHAWVEVRTRASSWATFDPTPPDTLQAINESRRTWVDRWRWMYDRIEFMWNSRVVGYDSAAQATLAERVGSRWSSAFTDLLATTRERTARLNAAFRLGPAGYIWLGLMAAVLLFAGGTLVWVARRARAVRRRTGLSSARRRGTRRLTREVGFYADALALLDRAGVAKPEWQPPMEFASGLAETHPELRDPVGDVVQAFYRVRFGGERLEPGAAERVLRRLAEGTRERSHGRRPS